MSNEIQQLVKMYKNSVKNALKYHNALEALGETVDLKQQIEYEMKKELSYVEKALEFKDQFREILKKHGYHQNDGNKLPNKHCLITIRPENVTDIQDFKSSILKGLNSKKIISYELAFEQSGKTKDEIGKGAHAHALCQVQDYCTVKDIIGIFKAPMKKYVYSIEVGKQNRKFIPDTIGLERAKNYIRGNKHNEEKELSVALDPIWRKMHNLEELYTSPNQDQTAQ